MKKEIIFKLIILIILTWIAFSIHNISNNNRYQFHYNSTNRILDTRTGKTFKIENNIPIEFSSKIE